AAAGAAPPPAPAPSAGQADAPRDPASLLASDCATCHHADDPRAPSAEALRGRSPQAIVDALTSGSMRYQGLALSGAERRAIAESLTDRKLHGSISGTARGRCAVAAPLGSMSATAAWNGWGADAQNSHFQPAAQAGLSAD